MVQPVVARGREWAFLQVLLFQELDPQMDPGLEADFAQTLAVLALSQVAEGSVWGAAWAGGRGLEQAVRMVRVVWVEAPVRAGAMLRPAAGVYP